MKQSKYTLFISLLLLITMSIISYFIYEVEYFIPILLSYILLDVFIEDKNVMYRVLFLSNWYNKYSYILIFLLVSTIIVIILSIYIPITLFYNCNNIDIDILFSTVYILFIILINATKILKHV